MLTGDQEQVKLKLFVVVVQYRVPVKSEMVSLIDENNEFTQ